MEALVLERKDELNLREIALQETLGPLDVRIAIHTVGVCGSDVHYYTHGGIGPFIVRKPMVLGHEASGTIIETGAEVEHLIAGDRVCMEPGVPDPNSRESRLGMYNLDPNVRFWATPPDHGVLRPTVVHPAAYTFKLPNNVSFAEGAMVEPLAVGMHAASKAGIQSRRRGRGFRRRADWHGHRVVGAGGRLQPRLHHGRHSGKAGSGGYSGPDNSGQRT